MNICRSVFFVLANTPPEKKLANLGNTSAFFPGDLQQGSFDLAANPESDTLVFR
jgi:hypothetical protein